VGEEGMVTIWPKKTTNCS